MNLGVGEGSSRSCSCPERLLPPRFTASKGPKVRMEAGGCLVGASRTSGTKVATGVGAAGCGTNCCCCGCCCCCSCCALFPAWMLFLIWLNKGWLLAEPGWKLFRPGWKLCCCLCWKLCCGCCCCWKLGCCCCMKLLNDGGCCVCCCCCGCCCCRGMILPSAPRIKLSSGCWTALSSCCTTPNLMLPANEGMVFRPPSIEPVLGTLKYQRNIGFKHFNAF